MIWLASPSRFAGLSRARARLGLVLLALLLATCLSALAAPSPPSVTGDPAQAQDDRSDVLLYDTIVDGVRHGGNYYQLTAQNLRQGDYPLRPFVTFRLPTLARVQALMPGWAVPILLYLLAASVMLVWLIRLWRSFARAAPLGVAVVLLAGGMAAFVQAELASFHEVWAGLLIALSLAVWRPGEWVAAVAIGTAAMMIRETAAVYVLAMLLLAWLAGERREAIGWMAALVLFTGVIAAHAWAVWQVTTPGDPASPGWTGLNGFGFFVQTMIISTALRLAWPAVAALLVGFALLGWAAWRDPTGIRALVTFALYAALIGIFGRVDTFYWGLMVAPTLLLGLTFAPDGLRDLIVAAFPRRPKRVAA